MKFKFYIPIFAVLALSSFTESFAQQISAEKLKRGTLSYYIHVVQKNETLSNIASVYKVTVKEIEEVNPNLDNPDKIKEGQRLTVPNFSSFINNYPRDKWCFELYKVARGDKLKTIAKSFNAEVKDIKAANPGIDNKPAENSEIRVPVLKTSDYYKNRPKEPATDNRKEIRNPALDFDWGKPDTTERDNDNDKEKHEKKIDCTSYEYDSSKDVFNISILIPVTTGNRRNNTGLAFVEGALLALEDIKNEGVSVNVNIADIGVPDRLNKTIDSKSFATGDLIIGPFSVELLRPIAEAAKEKEIPLVSPYEPRAGSMIKDNPYFIQVYPSDEAIYSKLTSESFAGKDVNPVLITAEINDSVMLGNYRKALTAKFGKFTEHVHSIGLRQTGLAGVLAKDKHNLVFICSNRENFVSDVLDRLNILRYKISVYGRARWRDFRLIDASRYFDLNLHAVHPFFVDYKNENVKKFVERYRKTYNNEPSQYAFQGYDVTYYFVSAMRKYGAEFLPCMTDYSSNLLQSNFKFVRPDKNGGFVNTGCFMIEYTSDTDIIIQK